MSSPLADKRLALQVGFLRRFDVFHAELSKTLAVARFESANHFLVLLTRLRQKGGVANAVGSYSMAQPGMLMNGLGQVAVTAGTEQSIVEPVVGIEDRLQVVPRDGLAVFLLGCFKFAKRLLVKGKGNALHGKAVKRRPHVVEFLDLTGRIVAHQHTPIGTAHDNAQLLKFAEGATDNMPLGIEAARQILFDQPLPRLQPTEDDVELKCGTDGGCVHSSSYHKIVDSFVGIT